MIVLFTDFGWQGPYVGELKTVLNRSCKAVSVIDLMHDAPRFDDIASAYLLATLSRRLPKGTIVLAVVDPGVGTEQRIPVVVEADGIFYVGPGNHLFNTITCQAKQIQWFQITWRPESLSASFHGRDLFAPIVAKLYNQEPKEDYLRPIASPVDPSWPEELAKVIYIDNFGNIWTGLKAGSNQTHQVLSIRGRSVVYAKTFGDQLAGKPFWYVNSSGLVELAVNKGSAKDLFSVSIGDEVGISDQESI